MGALYRVLIRRMDNGKRMARASPDSRAGISVLHYSSLEADHMTDQDEIREAGECVHQIDL
jgi:hypothetical protein